MATNTSTVDSYEVIWIRRGKGATADLPKPEKKDCKDTKALADLSKPAKHLESEEVEASSLNRKSSQQHLESEEVGTYSNIRAEISNIFGWDHDHEKCLEMDHVMSDYDEMSDFDDDDYSYGGELCHANSVEKLKPGTYFFSELEEEPEIASFLPPVSPPTSDFDELTLESGPSSLYDYIVSQPQKAFNGDTHSSATFTTGEAELGVQKAAPYHVG